ncbi:flagellin N-terminal helical domain-containing protein [Thiomicrorhabdus lithotrophica]|uniref:Flagellin n=1 Tax=Thiomicrorhabdus lithotrophica TaxID=2949997 RepID=A0ABY8CBL4_9GAMM|nr:flagellin [Thiomicrorhabdus lithotrophica]WEJ63368.1 flagellin [Thiomicrorhabdus lithotrophica]
MAMVINTNMASLNAVRMLNGTQNAQQSAMERLTSGLRINTAADDAAGLAVATGMTTQIRGTDMALRNANDGVGLLQTLDGASEEVVSMFQRMRELGIQALNGTYNWENRKQMDLEFTQLQNEIQRISDTTKFNGMNIMNASSFSALTAASVFPAASVGFSIPLSGMKLHIGWEAESLNQMKIPLMNFSTLSAINTAAFGLAASGSSDYTANVSFIRSTLNRVDTAISVLKTMRASWGALQNRLEYTISNLQNVQENIEASRSRIMDADFATESANLARTQVLQQAGMSMLSQANQQSQQVLQLLQ